MLTMFCDTVGLGGIMRSTECHFSYEYFRIETAFGTKNIGCSQVSALMASSSDSYGHT